MKLQREFDDLRRETEKIIEEKHGEKSRVLRQDVKMAVEATACAYGYGIVLRDGFRELEMVPAKLLPLFQSPFAPDSEVPPDQIYFLDSDAKVTDLTDLVINTLKLWVARAKQP